MYAIIQLQWHQYIVKVGDTITVDKLDLNIWDKYDCDQVLAIFDPEADNLSLGYPFLANKKVNFEIEDNIKWDKIRVVKFHRKNRYERNIGFRPKQTILKVLDIS